MRKAIELRPIPTEEGTRVWWLADWCKAPHHLVQRQIAWRLSGKNTQYE
jgi:hypothetical protein